MDTKLVLLYVADPLCSWCWGFAPIVSRIKEESNFSFQLVLGGLRPGETMPMDTKFANFLKGCWTQVNQASGQPFNFGLLTQTHFVYNTEPPSQAIRIIREMAPEKEFLFFKQVQEIFYVKNRNTNELKTYLDLCKELEIDEKIFQSHWNSPEIIKKTREDYALSREMGVYGFPALILKSAETGSEGQMRMVASGFTSYENVNTALSKAVDQLKK